MTAMAIVGYCYRVAWINGPLPKSWAGRGWKVAPSILKIAGGYIHFDSGGPRDGSKGYAIIDSEGTITIEMRVAGGRGLMRFILSWGPDVEVLEPAELLREIAAAYRSALAQYGEGH